MHFVYMYRLDRETEERAQRAIDQYFANNLIAPSPWSDPQKPKKKNILPATPNAYGQYCFFSVLLFSLCFIYINSEMNTSTIILILLLRSSQCSVFKNDIHVVDVQSFKNGPVICLPLTMVL